MALSSGQITGLESAIGNAGKLTVADYQRNYAWDVNAVEELFDDIVDLLADDSARHFMGSLILHKDKASTSVVDGQQRLTTIFVMAALLRDRLTELPNATIPGNASRRMVNVLTEIDDFIYLGKTLEPRFEGNYLIRDLFVGSILAQPHERPALKKRGESVTLPLRKAVWKLNELLDDQLTGLSENDVLERLHQLVVAVKGKLQVLVIESNELDESLEVFMTLNDRGVPLGPSDLVRGQLLINMSNGLEPEQQRAKHFQVLQEWESVLSLLDGASPDQYLRHYLLSTGNKKVQKKTIRDRVSERVYDSNPAVRVANSEKFWIDLCAKADTYSTLLNPVMDGPLSYYLASLKSQADSYRVLMLTVLSSEFEVEDSDRIEVARLSQALTLRWLIAGKNAQDLERFYQSCSNTLRERLDPKAVIAQIKAQLEFPFDSQALIAHGSISDLYVKVILHGIDQVLKGHANSVTWGTTHLELEHIAPQTAKGEWVESLLGDVSRFPEYGEVIDRVGNKTILDPGINRAVKQAPFGSKKQDYVTSQLIVTRDIALVDDWNEEIIDERGEWIAEMFDHIWAPTRAQSAVVAFSSWREAH